MNLGLGKQVGGKLHSWSLYLFWKTVEKFSVFLDGSNVTEPSFVWMGGREDFQKGMSLEQITIYVDALLLSVIHGCY